MYKCTACELQTVVHNYIQSFCFCLFVITWVFITDSKPPQCLSLNYVQMSLGKASTVTTELAQERGEVQISYSGGSTSTHCKTLHTPTLLLIFHIIAVLIM